MEAFVPGPTTSRARGGVEGSFVRDKPLTWTKDPSLILIGSSNRDKRPNSLVPGGTTNPDQRVPFGLGWWFQPRSKGSLVPVGGSNPDQWGLHVLV